MAFSPIGTKNFLTVHFHPFPIWRPQAARPLTGIHSHHSCNWPNASCTADHPERGFYQSHRHQTDHWFPGRPPETEGSHPGPGEEAPNLGKAPVPRGSGPPSAAGGWCKGRRWGTGWPRTQPRAPLLESESHLKPQTHFWDLGKEKEMLVVSRDFLEYRRRRWQQGVELAGGMNLTQSSGKKFLDFY